MTMVKWQAKLWSMFSPNLNLVGLLLSFSTPHVTHYHPLDGTTCDSDSSGTNLWGFNHSTFTVVHVQISWTFHASDHQVALRFVRSRGLTTLRRWLHRLSRRSLLSVAWSVVLIKARRTQVASRLHQDIRGSRLNVHRCVCSFKGNIGF